MPINRLYHNWFNRILQLRPGERITRARNPVRLIIGIDWNHRVHLQFGNFAHQFRTDTITKICCIKQYLRQLA
jgi:hypothetical protein